MRDLGAGLRLGGASIRAAALVAIASLAGLGAVACQSSPSSSSSSADGRVGAPLAARAGSGAGLAEGVTVTGSGRVTGRPDTLGATIGVEVEGSSVSEALAAANERAQAVIDAVRSAGVAGEDVRTEDLSVDARRSPEADPPEITGYTVRNLLSVTIREVDSAGEVLQAAVEAGRDAARIHGVDFSLEDNQQLLEQARRAAFRDARAKAEQYASLAESDLGRVVSISEEIAGPPGPPEPPSTAALQAGIPVEPGQEELVVTVTVVWELG